MRGAFFAIMTRTARLGIRTAWRPAHGVRHTHQVLALMKDGEDLNDVEVDLASQTVTRSNGEVYSFEVDPFRKHCLVHVRVVHMYGTFTVHVVY